MSEPITREERQYLKENALSDSICWELWAHKYEAALKQAEAEIERLRGKYEWRPIAEAPKDGRPIDILATGHIWSFKYPPSSCDQRVTDCVWDEDTNCWKAPRKEDEDDTAQHYIASHFMMRPEPPTEEQAE